MRHGLVVLHVLDILVGIKRSRANGILDPFHWLNMGDKLEPTGCPVCPTGVASRITAAGMALAVISVVTDLYA